MHEFVQNTFLARDQNVLSFLHRAHHFLDPPLELGLNEAIPQNYRCVLIACEYNVRALPSFYSTVQIGVNINFKGSGSQFLAGERPYHSSSSFCPSFSPWPCSKHKTFLRDKPLRPAASFTSSRGIVVYFHRTEVCGAFYEKNESHVSFDWEAIRLGGKVTGTPSPFPFFSESFTMEGV